MDDPWANAWGQESDITADDSKDSVWQTTEIPLWSTQQEPGDWEPSTYEGIQLTKPPVQDDSLPVQSWKSSLDSQDVPKWQNLEFNDLQRAEPSAEIAIDDDPQPAAPWTELEEHAGVPQWKSPLKDQHDSQDSAVDPGEDDQPPSSLQMTPTDSPEPVLPSVVVDSMDAELDGFGTFASGMGAEPGLAGHDPWAPATSLQAADGWGEPTWNEGTIDGPTSPSQEVHEHGQVDEWEQAKLQKERQDRQVPPELLASIFDQFEAVSKDLWPDKQEVPTEPYLSDRFRGLEAVSELLASASSRLVPTSSSLTLPPVSPTKTTFTHKSHLEALKLTRHMPIVQTSPMSFFLASKGNPAWDAAVRARNDKALQTGLSPSGTASAQGILTSSGPTESDFSTGGLGWRILGKDEREEFDMWSDGIEGKDKKMGSGGWFWKRKSNVNINGNIAVLKGSSAATPENSKTSSRSASPARPPSMASKVSSSIAVSSPRSSVDSSLSGSGFSSNAMPGIVSSVMSAGSTPMSSVPQTPTIGSPGPMQVAFNSEDVQLPTLPVPLSAPQEGSPSIDTPPAPAPSAVSRFLNRFSRTKSSTNNRASQHLALSSDDFEFLGDIHGSGGPSASSASTNIFDEDDLFGSSLESKHPKTEQKLPPPLAPPPKASTVQALPPQSSLLPSRDASSLSPSHVPIAPLGFNSEHPSSRSSPTALPFLGSAKNPPANFPSPATNIPTIPVTSSQHYMTPSSLPVFALDPIAQRSEPQAAVSALNFDAFDALASRSTANTVPSRAFPPISGSSLRAPMQVRKAKAPVTAIMSTGASTSSSSNPGVFSLPPPPSFNFPPPSRPSSGSSSRVPSRSSTPLHVSSSALSSPPNIALSPPPQMSPSMLSSAGEDDEFSDFHSSPAMPANVTPTSGHSANSHNFGSPLSATASQGSSGLGISSFSGLSPPVSALSSSSSSTFGSLLAPLTSEKPLGLRQGSLAMEVFDDFVSPSLLRSPSPPQPPAKPSGDTQGVPPELGAPLPLPPKAQAETLRAKALTPPPIPTAHGGSSNLAQRRNAKKADHTRTMSLLEAAAARPGVWPAPRSPIAPAIAAPPGHSQKADLVAFDDSPVVESISADLPLSVSSPAVLQDKRLSPPLRPFSPPVKKTQQPTLTEKSASGFDAFIRSTKAPSEPVFATGPAPSTAAGKSKGLSAQDLSFFEGL